MNNILWLEESDFQEVEDKVGNRICSQKIVGLKSQGYYLEGNS